MTHIHHWFPPLLSTGEGYIDTILLHMGVNYLHMCQFAYLWQVIIIGSITPLVTVPAMVTWGFELRPHRGYRNTHLIQFLPKLHIFRLWIYLRSSFMPHKDFAQLDCALLSKWRYTQQTRHGQKCTFTTASHTKYYVYFFWFVFAFEVLAHRWALQMKEIIKYFTQLLLFIIDSSVILIMQYTLFSFCISL